MKRLLLLFPVVLLGAGCIVHTVPTRYAQPVQTPAPAPVEVWYFGEHFFPESQGGGWCYEDGAHVHHLYVVRHPRRDALREGGDAGRVLKGKNQRWYLGHSVGPFAPEHAPR